MFNENNTTQRQITHILSRELGWREVKAVNLKRSIRNVSLLGELTAALQRLKKRNIFWFSEELWGKD